MWNSIWSAIYHPASLTTLGLLCSSVLGLVYWNRLSSPFRILILYLIFTFFIEIGAVVTGIIYRQNLPLLHLYTLGECLLFSLFYRQILDENALLKRYFNWVLGSALLLVVLNTCFLQGVFEFNSYSKTLVQLLIILYALDYAFRISSWERSNLVEYKALNLINTAVLIYYCGSLFIFMSGHFETEMGKAIQILWDINIALNLVFQIMILIALWKVIFNPRKSSFLQAPES